MAGTTEKPTCPKCGSLQILTRSQDKSRWCRVCGWDSRDQVETTEQNTESEVRQTAEQDAAAAAAAAAKAAAEKAAAAALAAAKNPTTANKAAAKAALQESTNKISEAGNKIAEAQNLAKKYAEVRKTRTTGTKMSYVLVGLIVLIVLLRIFLSGFRDRKTKKEKNQVLIHLYSDNYSRIYSDFIAKVDPKENFIVLTNSITAHNIREFERKEYLRLKKKFEK